MYKVVDNFLEKNLFKMVEETMLGEDVPWYPHPYVASKQKDSGDDSFYFTHKFFYNKEVTSGLFDTMIVPICFILMGRNVPLIRAKANLFTKREKQIKFGLHKDFDMDKHTTLVYSVNTNNGYTEFEDGTVIPSIANQLLIFDGNMLHRSVGQTDEKFRVNFNINIETDPEPLCKS